MSELISFGAGVNSSAMTIMLVNKGWRGPIVFADTGAEWPETYLVRDEGIRAYGGKCACCGESNPAFLTVEHKRGRKKEYQERGFRLTGLKMWAWLKAHHWPTDNHELLCFNCNCAKGIYGECPHKILERGFMKNVEPE